MSSIGLAQGLRVLGKNAVLALREPSLGPCMGIKGGATVVGGSQVLPMEGINFHFTGDIHAVFGGTKSDCRGSGQPFALRCVQQAGQLEAGGRHE